MLNRPTLLTSAVMAAALVLMPQAFAQTKKNTIQMSRSATINQLKANSGRAELKCTGPAGHMTCTSDYAWVCPSGWNACPAPSGGTCCTQD